MDEHFRDQDRRFNDKDLEEQDERADEDALMKNDIDQIEEELRRQDLNHDRIVKEEMRKYDQDAQHQVWCLHQWKSIHIIYCPWIKFIIYYYALN